MNMSKKSIITLLGFVTAGFALYYIYTQAAVFTTTSTSAVDLELALSQTEPFIGLGNELDRMNFDTSLFEDSQFQALRSFTGPIEEQATGRSNPFAPTQSSVDF
jgi:hypothetical protein